MSGGGSVTWVAVAALVVSLFTLGWNIYTAAHRAPRLRVGLWHETGSHMAIVGYGSGVPIMGNVEGTILRVTVANLGSESATVYDAGLAAGYLSLPIRAHEEWSQLIGDIDSLFEHSSSPVVVGPALPVEVPAHGVVEWQFSVDVANYLKEDESWHGFAERFRPGKRAKMIRSRESWTAPKTS